MPKSAVIAQITRDKINSDFAILDVKSRRKKLAKRVEAGEDIYVIIIGKLQPGQTWSHDDGTSIEFAVDVQGAYEIGPSQ